MCEVRWGRVFFARFAGRAPFALSGAGRSLVEDKKRFARCRRRRSVGRSARSLLRHVPLRFFSFLSPLFDRCHSCPVVARVLFFFSVGQKNRSPFGEFERVAGCVLGNEKNKDDDFSTSKFFTDLVFVFPWIATVGVLLGRNRCDRRLR